LLSGEKKSCSVFQKREEEKKMRTLTDTEMHAVLKKLAEYTGPSLKGMIALDSSPKADRNVFRISQQRVFCVRLSIANLATSITRNKLLSLGICLGSLNLAGSDCIFRHCLSLPNMRVTKCTFNQMDKCPSCMEQMS